MCLCMQELKTLTVDWVKEQEQDKSGTTDQAKDGRDSLFNCACVPVYVFGEGHEAKGKEAVSLLVSLFLLAIS